MASFDLNIVYIEGEDDDLYGILHLGRPGKPTSTVKILVSEHIDDNTIQRIDGLAETDVDLFLVISADLVRRVREHGFDMLLQRAIVLTSMELLDN